MINLPSRHYILLLQEIKEIEKSPLLNIYYIHYSNIHAHSSSLRAVLNTENTELNEASMPRPFNDGSYGVKPSLPPITINPEPVSRLSFFHARRRGLIYNPTDVTGSRCCYARAREHLKTNEKIQEGRKVGSNRMRAYMRACVADTADHFPRLHFHDWWSGSVSAAIDSVDWSDLRHPMMCTCRGITLSATLGPLNTLMPVQTRPPTAYLLAVGSSEADTHWIFARRQVELI